MENVSLDTLSFLTAPLPPRDASIIHIFVAAPASAPADFEEPTAISKFSLVLVAKQFAGVACSLLYSSCPPGFTNPPIGLISSSASFGAFEMSEIAETINSFSSKI
jgi:hypothetical protein